MSAKTRIIKSSDIDRCPKRSMQPSHYRDDGSCRCNEAAAAAAEMAAAKTMFETAHERVQAAERWLRST